VFSGRVDDVGRLALFGRIDDERRGLDDRNGSVEVIFS